MIDERFWHERWEKNEIPFHEKKTNPVLRKYFGKLSLRKGARVFVPLCGKTLDIHWLLANGYRVAGAELSPIAVEQLFAELGVKPRISKTAGGRGSKYSARNIDIFVGDIFGVTAKRLGRVDAIYDRAALVALPEKVRELYAAHMMRITNGAPQLLATFDYDQKAMDGPPFSISNSELVERYGKRYELVLLASAPVPGGLKGKCAAVENVWALARKTT
jgi:thiopurine S-methyltransferase